MQRYGIVVTNDDGIESAGLRALAEALDKVGDVLVVAPDRERSASSHALTLHKPLRVVEKRWGKRKVYAVNGTPSDCAFLAIKGLSRKKVDLVASGINPGANVGKDVTYSGTVSAAMEGAVLGVPSIAVSVTTSSVKSFAVAARMARLVAEWVLMHSLPKGVLLNVNVPPMPFSAIKGVRVCRQSSIAYEGKLEKRIDLRGIPYYWIGGRRNLRGAEKDSEIRATQEGYVSITPIHLDLTATFALTLLKENGIEKIKA